MNKDFRSYEDVVADVLARYSVTDLIEQQDEDLGRGDDLFHKGDGDINVAESGKVGLIKFWKIHSKGKVYECRRFDRFVFCSCKDFFFRKKMCRHLALTARTYCANCRILSAKVGKYCYDCDSTINRFSRPRTAEQISIKQ